jgi:uncharacterized protein (UPF0332 family)
MLKVAEEILNKRYQIQTCLDHTQESLESAALNIEHGYYSTAINRAYYAIFYAASALLLTKDISRSKHSGVLVAFRQHFVKPGLIESEYSDIYGDVMDARVDSDYDMTFEADLVTASERLADARRFVERVVCYLKESGWL